MASGSSTLWLALQCSLLLLCKAHFGGKAVLTGSSQLLSYCMFCYTSSTHSFVGLPHIPEAGNLAVGRVLTASSTCGVKRPENFCPIGAGSGDCVVECSGRNPLFAHPPSRMTDRDSVDSSARTWWQSRNNVAPVVLELNLGAKFFFTHVLLSFRSPRPAAMVIEKSTDSGRTYKPVQFYSNDCAGDFNLPDSNFPSTSRNASCTSSLSDIRPFMNGEVNTIAKSIGFYTQLSASAMCICASTKQYTL